MTENGFEYVDLGLPSGTMWATCNVGATKPEDEGLLFQFGRVDGYRFGDKNHKFITNEQNLEDGLSNKYIPLTTSGKTYNAGETLDLADDAAHVNMGGKWKVPTKDQLEELVNNTTHEVTINEVKGMMFTSKINGCQLFIPCAGFWYDGKLGNSNRSSIFIRSSNVHDSDVNIAYLLFYGLSGNVDIYYGIRSYAFAIRGVFKK